MLVACVIGNVGSHGCCLLILIVMSYWNGGCSEAQCWLIQILVAEMNDNFGRCECWFDELPDVYGDVG